MSGALFALEHLVVKTDISAVNSLPARLNALNGEFFDLGGDGLEVEQGSLEADLLNVRGRMANALSAKSDAGLGEELFAAGLEAERDATTEFLLDDFAKMGEICDASVDIGAHDTSVEFDVGLSFGDGEVRGSDAQGRDSKGPICGIDKDGDFLELELLEGTGLDVEVYFSDGFIRKAFTFGRQFEG